jgi:hypothetical protein
MYIFLVCNNCTSPIQELKPPLHAVLNLNFDRSNFDLSPEVSLEHDFGCGLIGFLLIHGDAGKNFAHKDSSLF